MASTSLLKEVSTIQKIGKKISPAEFVAACERALALRSDREWLRPVDALLSTMSWDDTASQMKALIVEASALLRRADAGLRDAQLRPMRLFHYSNSYLALVFIAAAIDPLLS